MRFRQPLLASLIAALLATQPLCAQTPASVPNDAVTMNMRDADIRTLIQWIADQTGKNMIVHRDVQGKVNVLSAKPVTREEAYRIFLSVLQVHGYAAIDTGEAVKIVPANIATQSGLPARNSYSDDMVVQVFKVNNVAATELAQMLKPLASREAVVNADASTNMLLVADHANNVEQLQNLVQKLDRSGASEVELVRLQHANAKQVLTSLSTLFPSQSTTNVGAPGQGNNLPLSLSADERSNSILIGGDASKRAQVRRLIQQMDTEITGSGNTQVLYLQYASAKEVVPILKSIAQSVLKDQKDKETSFSIDASESANAVVINAPPGLADSLKGVVEKLDVRRAQVLVEALIVEVNSEIANDIGVIWGTTNVGDLHGSGAVAGVNALGNLDLIGKAAGIAADGTIAANGIPAPAGGFTLGYYSGGNLQAAIRALSANTKANIISTPTIVAIDNEEASLLVGQNIPLKTGQETSSSSSTSNPFVTIERKDIGTTLQITPRINQGNTLTLTLKQKVESVTTAISGASDIVTNKREIDTKVLMRDDQILVLGGLISDEQTGNKQKVPILGDLPLIGKLFSSDSNKHTKNNLMVFIHPVILRDDERARQVSQENYQYMQRAQEKSLQPPHPTTEKNPTPPAKMPDFDVFSPVRAQP